MTTWTEITNSQLDQDSPITQPLVTAFRDNVRAAAEQVTDAPVITTLLHPYDMVDVGDGATGEIWSFASDGATSTISTGTLDAGWDYRVLFDGMIVSGAVSVGIYKESAASWATFGTTSSLTASETYYGSFSGGPTHIAGKVFDASLSMYDVSVSASSPVAVTAGDVRTYTSADRVSNIRITTGGSFTGGAAYLYRVRNLTAL